MRTFDSPCIKCNRSFYPFVLPFLRRVLMQVPTYCTVLLSFQKLPACLIKVPNSVPLIFPSASSSRLLAFRVLLIVKLITIVVQKCQIQCTYTPLRSTKFHNTVRLTMNVTVKQHKCSCCEQSRRRNLRSCITPTTPSLALRHAACPCDASLLAGQQ